jgi:hypothetical protein
MIEQKDKKHIEEENWEIPVKLDCIVSQDRCTCSIHGEKEHSVPSCLNIFAAEGIASQGCGRSKKTASAKPANSSGKPSL